MSIFLNVFLKTFAIFISISLIIIITIVTANFIESETKNEFLLLSGELDSANTIAIIELNGLIIEKTGNFSDITNPFIISPSKIKKYLENLKSFSPKVIIFSINSPGGTVSASKNFYDIITDYKKNNDTEILFHTNELLASGGYWASTSADGIYASYGSIIGSIGVKGPDWFYYDEPTSISTGIFGNNIETKKGIKVFSNKAGKSKDILNPFRKPEMYELEHLQEMVNDIYDEFVRVVSKERKIEIKNIKNNIGALIYTTKKAKQLHLIDDQLSLDNLISKIIKEKNFQNYKIIKRNIPKTNFLEQILQNNNYTELKNIKYECLSLRSSISAILSYSSTGC